MDGVNEAILKRRNGKGTRKDGTKSRPKLRVNIKPYNSKWGTQGTWWQCQELQCAWVVTPVFLSLRYTLPLSWADSCGSVAFSGRCLMLLASSASWDFHCYLGSSIMHSPLIWLCYTQLGLKGFSLSPWHRPHDPITFSLSSISVETASHGWCQVLPPAWDKTSPARSMAIAAWRCLHCWSTISTSLCCPVEQSTLKVLSFQIFFKSMPLYIYLCACCGAHVEAKG